MLIYFLNINIKYILLNYKHNINKFLFKIMSLTTHYFNIIKIYCYFMLFGIVDTIKMVINYLLISYRILIIAIISYLYIKKKYRYNNAVRFIYILLWRIYRRF